MNNVSTAIPYTFGSINAILTGKYGKENGILRWKDRQEKWHNSYKKSKKNGYSKISQELFWKLFERINLLEKKSDSGDAQYVKSII